MNNRLKIILVGVTISLLMSCGSKTERLLIHKINLIKISNEVNLELLDWGGTGTPMLFLSGLGNSAHVFDDFAPKFTDKFHVYALTRRGFGASSQPKNGYDIKTLSRDIISVIDHLHLKKVILVGHSIAGEEITKIGNDYPDRIEKVIYLDAAFDRTDLFKQFALLPEYPVPNAADSISIQSIKKFIKKVNGVNMPKEELQQTMVFSKEGKYIKDVTPDSLVGSILKSVVKPEYSAINCPSLAIYAKYDSPAVAFPFYETLDSINKKKANQFFPIMSKIATESSEHFLKESKNGVIKRIKGMHYIFLSNPHETEKTMRDFLK